MKEFGDYFASQQTLCIDKTPSKVNQSVNSFHTDVSIVCLTLGSLGGSTVEACQQCPAGHYCHHRGRAEPSGQCAEGYYCPEGQSSERPQQHICSVGHCCEKVSCPV